ncbi:unnamed protein product [Meloidogyne enterolobii]|uniref:Uncharacterized protein n=1 Tax=Meloidogyne enterolobii TaxID=390850 RepID=A0ACB1AVU3_MELEN
MHPLLDNANSIGNAMTSTDQSSTDLLDFLFGGYDKRIRPFSDQQRPVIIEMTIVLAILTELKWKDPRLIWDPKLFSGLKQIVVPHSTVWLPKMFIYNSMDNKEMLTENRFDIRISSDGHIKANIPHYLFPFDTQFCAIAQASPLLSIQEMDVNTTKPPKDSYFSGNAEWELLNVTVRATKFMEDGEERVEVHYIIHLRRRPVYYITVIVAPTFLISALSILGIFTPGTNDGPRGEKVSLGLGSLLAMSVLLDIVSAAMPRSNSIPLLGHYIIFTIVLCAVGVGVSMLLLAMSRHFIQSGELPSEKLYRNLLLNPYQEKHYHTSAFSSAYKNYKDSREPLNNNCELDYYTNNNNKNGQPNNFILKPKISYEFQTIQSQLQIIVDAQKKFREKIEMHKERQMIQREWNRVFARFDYLFLFIFSGANLLFLILFLRYMWHPAAELPVDFGL